MTADRTRAADAGGTLDGLAGQVDRLFQGMSSGAGEAVREPEAPGVSEASRVPETPTVPEAAGAPEEAPPEPAAAPDEIERLIAATEAGDDGSLAAARAALTPETARQLAFELGRAARDEARRRTLTRLVARLGEAMAAPLADALTEANERVERRAYVEALAALGGGALPVVREMVTDGRWFVVRNALLVLRDAPAEEGIEHFTAALAHPDPRVRREALLSLAHVGGEAAALLAPSKLTDAEPQVREAAAMASGALRVVRALKPLLEQLEREDSPDVQVALLLALGRIGDPGAVPPIERRAQGGLFGRRPPPEVRAAAYRALWAIGTPHAKRVVESAQGDRDPEVREEVGRLVQPRG